MAKQGIHPKYYPKAKIICSCGARYEVGSTVPEIHVEVCSRCHPFFTGEQKFIDTGGRLERFKQIMAKSQQLKEKMEKAEKKKAEKEEQKQKQKKSTPAETNEESKEK